MFIASTHFAEFCILWENHGKVFKYFHIWLKKVSIFFKKLEFVIRRTRCTLHQPLGKEEIFRYGNEKLSTWVATILFKSTMSWYRQWILFFVSSRKKLFAFFISSLTSFFSSSWSRDDNFGFRNQVRVKFEFSLAEWAN